MSENQGCVLCGITGNLNPISELLLEIFGPNVSRFWIEMLLIKAWESVL